MTQARADFIELLCKFFGQGLGGGETAFEDPVGDVSIAQSQDRRAEDGHARGRARIVARRQHQRDRPADRYADNCRLSDIDLVEVRFRPLVETFGRVCGFRNVRPAVPGIIEGMDREMLLELRNDFLEYVELGSERMQENEVRADPGSDAADSHAAEIHILHRNAGGPDQCFGPLRGRPQGFDDVGKYDQRDEDCQDGNQYPGDVHGAIPSGLAAAKTLRPTGVGSIDSVNTASSLRTFALRAVSETVRA